MPEFAKEILPIALEDEMRQSYLDYAMSVIVGRALPDVRDGLKPVHRRVLYAMHELGNEWNKPYKKSARVVGDVIGKYHPHGDTAVYDTLVRMAQPFSLRYLLIDGQGNFGSVDGDAAAAMRYTEVRMSRMAQDLLADLDKETVDFIPNYDGSEREPAVLPARFPNLLVNGAAGIAVGMATNIPPHNLGEVIDACLALIDDPALSIEALMARLPGPDFPTAAIINGVTGLREAYRTGRGRLYLRARTHQETHRTTGRESIIVDELPYQVNKARLLERMAELVKEKKLEGIAELRDESDKDGMRIVIELKRDQYPDVVLNNLYQHTQLQTVFGINMVALVEGRPRLLNLKQLLECFLQHRREVVTRRTLFELRKARARAHVLEGLAVALANLDGVIARIKGASGPADAKAALLAGTWRPGPVSGMLDGVGGAPESRPDDLDPALGLQEDGYHLSPAQVQAILDLRLHRLTGLEQERILQEFQALLKTIAELLAILSHPRRLMGVIREELETLRAQYGDARRTTIQQDRADLTLEDLIVPEDRVVTFSHAGYVKTQPLSEYRAQRRGGRGKSAAATKEDDFIENLFVAHSHDQLLCFSSRGKVYWLRVYELPQASRASRGRPMVNLLPLEPGERISAVLPVGSEAQEGFVFMATSAGTVKKTPLADFSHPRSRGLIAIHLREGEYLVDVAITDGTREILLFSSDGKAVRFQESAVRSMGRTAHGVRGILLGEGQRVISMALAEPGTHILCVTENGYGKRTPIEAFPTRGRGTKGVIGIRTSPRNGQQVGAVRVSPEDELMLITVGGTLIRTRVAQVPVLSRATQGVRLIRLASGERLAGIAPIPALEDDQDVQTEATDGTTL